MAQRTLSDGTKTLLKGALQALWVLSGNTLSSLTVDLGEQLQAQREGAIPSARCKVSVNPSNNDTVGIGGHVFKFVSSLGAAAAQTQVKIGATLAATMASLVNAVNQSPSAPVVDATVVAGTTPFCSAAVAGGWSVAADLADATHLRVRQVQFGRHGQANYATYSSGLALTPASVALAASLTQAGDGWMSSNLQETGATPGRRSVYDAVTITSTMIGAGHAYVELPADFTPRAATLRWDGYDASGVRRAVDEAVTLSGRTIVLVLAGGGSPNWQDGDRFVYQVSE